jgi:hypothetical protein
MQLVCEVPKSLLLEHSVSHWPLQYSEQLKLPGLTEHLVPQLVSQAVAGVAVQVFEHESTACTLQLMEPAEHWAEQLPRLVSYEQVPDRGTLSASALGAKARAAPNDARAMAEDTKLRVIIGDLLAAKSHPPD